MSCGPPLTSVFQSAVVDAAVRIMTRLTPFWFTRISQEPVVMGIAMRVTETQVALNAVANLPVSLQGAESDAGVRRTAGPGA